MTRNCSSPSEAVQPQQSTPSSGSQRFIRVIQTWFSRVSPSYSRSSIANILVSVERISEPRSKLGKKDRFEAKMESIKRSINLTPEARRLWQNFQHLPIKTGRELLKQHLIEAAELDRVWGEIFEKLRPHRQEHIWTEEQYENSYQSQKEEIIEEVVTGDVDLL